MRFFSGRGGRLRLAIVGIAIVIVVLALVLLYAVRYSPAAQVTVTGGVVHLEEGQGPGGWWFGPPTRNYTNGSEGFPITVDPNAEFSVVVPIVTTDTHPHSIVSITALSPFSFASANSPLPVTIAPGNDDDLVITLHAPGSSGTYAFDVTVEAQ